MGCTIIRPDKRQSQHIIKKDWSMEHTWTAGAVSSAGVCLLFQVGFPNPVTTPFTCS